MSPEPPAAGYVLREPESKLAHRLAIVLVVVPVATIILVLVAGIGWGLLLGALVLAVVAAFDRDAWRAALAWHPPRLEVSAEPFALGSTPVVRYHRRPKRPTDVPEFHVECSLTCTEEVTYTRGSDTTTDRRSVVERTIRSAGEGTAKGMVAEFELPISAHRGAPTMRLPHNKVEWSVEIEVRGPRLPKDSHRFAILVGPTLDTGYRAGVQDS